MDTETELAKLRTLHEAVKDERAKRDTLRLTKSQEAMIAFSIAKLETDVALADLQGTM